MKKLLTFLFALVICYSSRSQTVMNDALELRSLLTETTDSIPDPNKPGSKKIRTIYKIHEDKDIDGDGQDNLSESLVILSRYFKTTAGDSVDKIVIKNKIQTNEFLTKYLGGSFASPASTAGKIGLSNIISGAAGLDVTAFADGLAKFLVQRTKEELNESFFRKFKTYLDNYPEFKVLFPNTNTLIANFSTWQYANILNTLREAFDKDIKSLLGNFPKLTTLKDSSCPIRNGKLNTVCSTRINAINEFFSKKEGHLLLSGMAVGDGIISGRRIPDIIETLASPSYLNDMPISNDKVDAANFSNSIKFIGIISKSLRSDVPEQDYISDSEFKALKDDPILRDIFLGLVYQLIANEDIKFTVNSSDIVVTKHFTPANVEKIVAYLGGVKTTAALVDQAFKNLEVERSKLKTESDLRNAYARVLEATQKLFNAVSQTQIIAPQLQMPAGVSTWLGYTNSVLQISHDIAVRNYNAAVMSTLKLLDDVVIQTGFDTVKPAITQFTGAFLKYGSFAANVVNSKDPDEIKDAIQAFVLPVGSSSLKKYNQFSISINGYVGFAYGVGLLSKQEYFTSGSDTVQLNSQKSYAIYAPVGVALNKGIWWKGKNPMSASLFISLIDLGAIVGYRFDTDTGMLSNKIRVNLGNIFAPGANLLFGLPNMPISLGGGVQWIPTLQRDPSSNDIYNLDRSAWRVHLVAAVDLALLNIHTSKKSLLYVKGRSRPAIKK